MSSPPRVLVVEDEPAIQELLRMILVQAGFAPLVVSGAEQALAEIRSVLPAVVLIDVMLPGMSGTSLVRCLRREARTRELPLILVTARAEERERVAGLELGADDYVTKPFSSKELVARIRAVLRRRAPHLTGDAIEVGSLRLDPSTREVDCGGRRVDLGPTEFELLHVLMARPGRVFSRDQLLDALRGDHRALEDRTIDVYVRRLRLALGAEGETMIETVRGVGYRLADPRT